MPRALILTGFHGLDAVELADVPDPSPGPGAVTVRVRAAAVGAWDLATADGSFAPLGGQTTFPQVLGWDFAGEVESLGDGVTGWAVGDRVLGFSPQPWSGIGVFAERVAIPAELLSALPAAVGFADGAALPVTALTAELALDAGQVGAGSTVLVIGATGAVGGALVQLARSRGATVLASVAASQSGVVQALGAAHAVDRDGDVAAQVRAAVASGVDAAIDCAGTVAWPGALAALRDGGRFVTTSVAGLPDSERGITCAGVAVAPDPVRLGSLAERVAAGTLLPRVATVVPLEKARLAIGDLRHGGLDGKLVLDLG